MVRFWGGERFHRNPYLGTIFRFSQVSSSDHLKNAFEYIHSNYMQPSHHWHTKTVDTTRVSIFLGGPRGGLAFMKYEDEDVLISQHFFIFQLSNEYTLQQLKILPSARCRPERRWIPLPDSRSRTPPIFSSPATPCTPRTVQTPPVISDTLF